MQHVFVWRFEDVFVLFLIGFVVFVLCGSYLYDTWNKFWSKK